MCRHLMRYHGREKASGVCHCIIPRCHAATRDRYQIPRELGLEWRLRLSARGGIQPGRYHGPTRAGGAVNPAQTLHISDSPRLHGLPDKVSPVAAAPLKQTTRTLADATSSVSLRHAQDYIPDGMLLHPSNGHMKNSPWRGVLLRRKLGTQLGH